MIDKVPLWYEVVCLVTSTMLLVLGLVRHQPLMILAGVASCLHRGTRLCFQNSCFFPLDLLCALALAVSLRTTPHAWPSGVLFAVAWGCWFSNRPQSSYCTHALGHVALVLLWGATS